MTADRRTRSRWPIWFLVIYSIAYGVAMMVMGGATFTKLYAPSPYHLLEADAMLQGKFQLADSLYQIQHDLAWHDGHVQEIWGLGVGMWLLPFEALWRLFGLKWFPDRIALGAAFALLAWYGARTGCDLAERSKSPAAGIGLIWLITLCPALWTLNQGGRLIYEETCLYACLVSLGILVTVVRVACFGRRSDFFICAALSAMSAVVRPTHGIYGLAGMFVCTAILLARRGRGNNIFGIPNPSSRALAVGETSVSPRRADSESEMLQKVKPRFSIWSLVLGNSVFVAGLLFLALTNWWRFGSPTEFGHRLSVTPSVIVYMTRIDNPMKEASVVQAAKELFGWLFLTRDVRSRRPGEKYVPGQAPYERWRDPYMTTFTLVWAGIVAIAFVGSAIWVWRQRRAALTTWQFLQRPGRALVVGTLAWGGVSAAALTCFFLHFACMSSRYLLDFAPAFTALALVFWLPLLRRAAWLSLIALALWLGYENLTAQVRPAPVPLRTRQEIPLELAKSQGQQIDECDGVYSFTNDPGLTDIHYNGYGWDTEKGSARNIVILALDRPEFVELLVGPCQGESGHAPRPDLYRAMIDGQFLHLREVQKEGDLFRVRFDVPGSIRRRAGDELLFICFTKGFDEQDRNSKRVLQSVRWR